MQHASTRSCSRRGFLKGCGLTLTGFGVASLFPTPLIEQALAGTLTSEKRLLFIFLRGGNDGINTVIPHGDAAYGAAIRPTLYIAPEQAIDLNGFASLHPALADMMDPFNAGDLAVLHRVGYENNSQSHFDGQRIWENGNPAEAQLFEGWLYRYIRDNMLESGGQLPALSIQGLPPVLLSGDEKFVNIANPDQFDYVSTSQSLTAKYGSEWRETFDELVGLEPYRPVLSQTGVKLADTLDMYEAWHQAAWDPKDPNTSWSLFPVSPQTDQAGFGPQAYPFFAALKVAALSLLESSSTTPTAGTRVAGTQLGGWDTHNQQGQLNGSHAGLLRLLAYGFKSLRTVFSGAAIDSRSYPTIWDDTVVFTMSEFGRTTLENGSNGTDHAAASCMFLQGGSVNGGVYNCDATTWPAGVMTDVQGRYLRERTDYRAVFWEIMRDHMGAPAGSADGVFPGYGSLGLGSQELGLIGSGA